MLKKSIVGLLLLCSFISFSQVPKKPNPVEIYEQVQKLNFLGKVLYIAAHPDDENTKLITYFSNQYHAQTAYLSLTRGDGGQNLIGPELREKLGAIRTQELLAARNIDGGEQFFTRANDFGYSKEPNETFSIWNKKEVLEDVIQTIDTFQPDIIINRFNHRTPGTTHGHHTASAILSLEAFDLVKHQPKRVFFNTSWWFYGSQENFDKADKSNLVSFNANVYYPLKGKSNNEIAALSRSQHKCQGFGSTGTRGDEVEYLELLKGNLPKTDNIFEGIDTSWNRVDGGKEIGQILNEIEANFNFKNPSSHIPDLVKAYVLIEKLKDKHWKTIKLKQISSIIEACSGLYLEAVSTTPSSTKDGVIQVNFEVINRSLSNSKLVAVSLLNSLKIEKNITLKNNEKIEFQIKEFPLPMNVNYSNLYWLNERPTVGMYQVYNKAIRILPEERLQFPIDFTLEIEGKTIHFIKNLVYKINEPESGETYTPFTVLPNATSEIINKVTIFNANQTKDIAVKVTSHASNFNGKVSLNVPENWKVTPNEIPTGSLSLNESKTFIFKVSSTKIESNSILKAEVTDGKNVFDKELVSISYNHIPKQTILQPSEATIVNLDIKTSGKNIGYLMGVGDEVGKYIENLGYNITYLGIEDIEVEKLAKYDAVILGIRAFNVVDALNSKNKQLFDYTKNGGTVIVQYNTTSGLITKNVAPYDLKISRDRVTNENATITILNPKESVLNYPNKITSKDFEGWIQERGLYFPSEWDEAFTPIFEMADTGEKPVKGSVLVAKYGKGYYCYTGISFFRQLPEGVSGAYKLLANLIALKQ